MPESLRGNNSDQNQIRHSYYDNVNSPVNKHTTDETEIVHLGKINTVYLLRLERKLIRHYETQEHVNVCYLLKVTK